jgi:hypothetical protein
VTQAVEHLLCKHETLSLNPSPISTNKQQKNSKGSVFFFPLELLIYIFNAFFCKTVFFFLFFHSPFLFLSWDRVSLCCRVWPQIWDPLPLPLECHHTWLSFSWFKELWIVKFCLFTCATNVSFWSAFCITYLLLESFTHWKFSIG